VISVKILGMKFLPYIADMLPAEQATSSQEQSVHILRGLSIDSLPDF
jgi:hypothetical protein